MVISVDQSLTGKGKLRRPRKVATTFRQSTVRGDVAFIRRCASLPPAAVDVGRACILLYMSMLTGCSRKALEAFEIGSRCRDRHLNNKQPVLLGSALGPGDVAMLLPKNAQLSNILAGREGAVGMLEGAYRDETDASGDDSFKMVFRELRGSIDPDLKLEI